MGQYRRQRVTYGDFRGGLCEDKPALATSTVPFKDMAQHECIRFENFCFRERGRLVSRGGIQQLGTAGHADILNAALICAQPNGDAIVAKRDEVTPANGVMYFWDDSAGTWTKVTLTGPGAAFAGNVNCLKYWNGYVYAGVAGAAMVRIAEGTAIYESITGSPQSVTSINIIKERMFVTSEESGHTKNVRVGGLSTHSDWSSFDYNVIDIPDTSANGTTIGACALNDSLVVFCQGGIWIMRGYSPDAHALDLITSETTLVAAHRHTMAEAELAGLGRAVLFVDALHEIRAVTTGGCTRVSDNLAPRSTIGLTAAHLQMLGQYVITDATNKCMFVVFTKRPFGDGDGRRWPVAKFSITNANIVFNAVARQVLSSGYDRLLIAMNDSAGTIGCLAEYRDVTYDDANFSKDDKFRVSAADAYYQVPAVIRTRPEDCGTHLRKVWKRAIVVMKPNAALTALAGTQYLNKASDSSAAIPSTTAASVTNLALSGVSDYTSIAIPFYSAASSATAIGNLVELEQIEIEFVIGPA